MSQAEGNRRVRLQVANVGEYQLRGAIHVHAIARIDAAPTEGDPNAVAAPPAEFTTEHLEAGVRAARASAVIECPELAALGRADTSIRCLVAVRGLGLLEPRRGVDGELGHVVAAGARRNNMDPTSTGSDRAESATAAARRQPHLAVPALVCFAPGVRMVVAQAPRGLQGDLRPPLLRGRMVATCRRRLAVQPDETRDHSVPLPRSSDPNAVGERGVVNQEP
jgi:hypothetical protein